MLTVGNDIEKISRFKQLIEKPSFFEKVYTQHEREYILSRSNVQQSAAGIYCAKEAVAKAIGTGFGTIRPNNIEIYHDGYGAPYGRITGISSNKYKNIILALSISHCDEYAMATCIAQSE